MHIGVISNLVQQNTINNNRNITNSLEKLSTGLKINKAADDASGLAISDKLRTQASGIKQGIENANSAVAMMNIADRAISELSNILDIIKAKSIQMNTDTTSEEGRVLIKNDILKLIDSYDNIVCSTNYNQIPLLTGCESPFDFQVAPKSSDIISVDIENIEARQMGNPDPFKLKNFISGFAPFPAPPTNIGNIWNNGLDNLSPVLTSNPKGEFMIEVPAGFENLTIFLDEFAGGGLGGGDTLQIFTKDGKHISGTPSTSEDWQHFGTSPAEIINDNPDKFNTGATYQNSLHDNGGLNLSYYGPYHDDLNPSLQVNVDYIDKDGNSASKIIGQDNEMVVIEKVSTPLVIFVNGGGIYQTSAEWSKGKLPEFIDDVPGCACDATELIRDDTDLKLQAQTLMDVVDTSLTQLNSQRANVGAGTNQLESSIRNNMTGYVQLKNAESVIRDVDYAQESANFSKLNIISQAGSFALSQVNQVEQNWVLQLLK